MEVKYLFNVYILLQTSDTKENRVRKHPTKSSNNSKKPKTNHGNITPRGKSRLPLKSNINTDL